MRANTRLMAATLMSVLGCSQVEPGEIIDHDAWELASPEQDPFFDRLTEPIDCPRGAYRVEGEGDEKVFELDTGLCNYLAIVQPSLREIRRGDTLEWSMWHLNLVAVEPAEAVVGLFVGGQTVWERTIPIPGAPGAYLIELTTDFDAPEGTPVVVHIHNHGVNNWKLHRLRTK